MKEAGEEKELELTPTGRVKKRKMKRKPARFKQELKEKTGLSYEGTIKGLRINLQNKKNRIKVLEQRIREFKENEGKVVHERLIDEIINLPKGLFYIRFKHAINFGRQWLLFVFRFCQLLVNTLNRAITDILKYILNHFSSKARCFSQRFNGFLIEHA